MSCEHFYRQLEDEIDRLDDLFNGLPARHRARIEDPLLETPGLAIIASRTTALRREYLAGIAISSLGSESSIGAASVCLTVLANHSPSIFLRQILAQVSRLKFEVLDHGQLDDADWPCVSSGVSRLEEMVGVRVGDESANSAASRLRWETTILSIADLLSIIAGSPRESAVIVENYHLISDVGSHPDAIRDLRNAAVATGVYLYIGCGLTHWHEVRGGEALYLSDLTESLAESVHLADLITLLAPTQLGMSAVVYDPRYSVPWRGNLGDFEGDY